MEKLKGPVLIERDDAPDATPATAAPVPDLALAEAPEGRAMIAAASLAARPPSKLWRFFWVTFTAFAGFVLSVWAWSFVTGLLAASPALGWIAAGLASLLVLAVLLIVLREWSAYARLARIDGIRQAAEAALLDADLAASRRVVADLATLYSGRPEAAWGRRRLAETQDNVFDAHGLIGLAERELLAAPDRAAEREIERAARQVATVTAVVPLALADVAAALVANLGMIRRIAAIYGGRAGTLGGWRLTRAVMGHLVATGAVAVGDDLIQSLAGGGLLAKLSRRFGEGVVNGALTARVGVAAMEVCRPLPFTELQRPKVTALLTRALKGLFGRSVSPDEDHRAKAGNS